MNSTMQDTGSAAPHLCSRPSHSCVLLNSAGFTPTATGPGSDLPSQAYVSGYLSQCYPKRPQRNQEAGHKSKVSSLLKGHTVRGALNCCWIGPYRVCQLEPHGEPGVTRGAQPMAE